MFFNPKQASKSAEKFLKNNRKDSNVSDSLSLSSKTSPSFDQLDKRGVAVSIPSSITSPTNHRSPSLKKGSVSYVEHTALESLQVIQKTIESQEIREGELETSIKTNITEAKGKMAIGNRRSAIRSMKKVKLEQVELDKVSAVIEKLEAQKLQIESSLNNIKVLKVMQEGSSTLQKLNNNTKVEDVDIVMDEIRDTIEITAEINDILSAPIDDLLFDEDELLKELEGYQDDKKIKLPVVPKKPPPSSQHSLQQDIVANDSTGKKWLQIL